MKAQVSEDLDIGALVREVRRYLAAVDTFRAEGREPHWLPEWPAVESSRALRGIALAAPPIP